jgi:hypothetical protein
MSYIEYVKSNYCLANSRATQYRHGSHVSNLGHNQKWEIRVELSVNFKSQKLSIRGLEIEPCQDAYDLQNTVYTINTSTSYNITF